MKNKIILILTLVFTCNLFSPLFGMGKKESNNSKKRALSESSPRKKNKPEKTEIEYFNTISEDVLINEILTQDLNLEALYKISQINKQFCEFLKQAPLKLSLATYKIKLNDEIFTKICERFKGIRKLNIIRACNLQNIKSIINLKYLEELVLSSCNIEDISILEKLEFLTNLTILSCDNIKNIDTLHNCISLKNLVLMFLNNVKNLDFLENHYNLTTLNISNLYSLTNIDALTTCPYLKKLKITSCNQITNQSINKLANCYNLEEIEIDDYDQIKQVLQQIHNLKNLLLSYAHITDEELQDLVTKCPNLEKLDITNSNRITNILILANCKKLKVLNIRFCTQIPKAQIDFLKTALPNLEIIIDEEDDF